MKETTNLKNYPIVLKFAFVALIAFIVYIFFLSNIVVKMYCVVLFLAVTNGWAAAEHNTTPFTVIYLLDETVCIALYFLMALDLLNNKTNGFWLYSSLIFLFYYIWNLLLKKDNENNNYTKRTLESYNKCNIVAMVYTIITYIILMYTHNQNIILISQIAGGLLWLLLLIKWYYDNYFKENLSL